MGTGIIEKEGIEMKCRECGLVWDGKFCMECGTYKGEKMSEPEVEWYVQQIKRRLKEIDDLVSSPMTNAIREIVMGNTNEIEIDLHTIIRKLTNGKG